MNIRHHFNFLKLLVISLIAFAWIYSLNYHEKIYQKLQRFDYLNDVNDVKADENKFDKEFIEIDPAYKKYIKELGLKDPGENGEGVVLPENISDEIKQKVQEGYDRHGFNAFVSNLISLNRKVPDPRNEICRQKVYKNLPKCSIVIPFYNEEWTLLMRTIHSILNRSPHDLIEEILLADDASDREEMLGPLDAFIAENPKMRIIRSPVRHGIIQNRMSGAINAVGPVLVFVDSHCEVMHGWLEPLLDRFVHQRNVLATIFNMRLNTDTLQFDNYNIEKPIHFGGFNFNMDFAGILIDWYEKDNPLPPWDPKPCPTIYGSTHAIRKDYFIEIGMFDPDFDIWGGEDVELSFRVWMCGGRVEFVPCSVTAHLSKHHRYTWPSSEKGGYSWNTDRMAEIWLDEYKKYYYRAVGVNKRRNFGNISERLALKEKLGCKGFKWFYENIYKNASIDENLLQPQEDEEEF